MTDAKGRLLACEAGRLLGRASPRLLGLSLQLAGTGHATGRDGPCGWQGRVRGATSIGLCATAKYAALETGTNGTFHTFGFELRYSSSSRLGVNMTELTCLPRYLQIGSNSGHNDYWRASLGFCVSVTLASSIVLAPPFPELC
jgi:hypothetical protein